MDWAEEFQDITNMKGSMMNRFDLFVKIKSFHTIHIAENKFVVGKYVLL